MPFIRLSDDFDDHPKFAALSDGAFRLWCQTLAYSRRYETDGVVPLATVKTRRAYSPARVTELLKPWKAGENPLWQKRNEEIAIHDYLQWNHSKSEADEKRLQDAIRQRKRRAEQPTTSHALSQRDTSRTVNGQHAVVVDMGTGISSSEGMQGEPSLGVVQERRAVPDRRFLNRKLGRGVFEGALPADHLDHAACSPNLSWCVPNAVHARLVTALSPRYGGDRAQADATLKGWYPTVFAALPAETVIADDFKFWRGRASAAFSTPQQAQQATRAVPGTDATAALVASIKASVQ